MRIAEGVRTEMRIAEGVRSEWLGVANAFFVPN